VGRAVPLRRRRGRGGLHPRRREPTDDAALVAWLHSWLPAAPAPTPSPPPVPVLGSAPPPRWDDATLLAFAGLSSTIACECPKHLAELLMQLTQFEAYSADCANQGPTDAELHRYLGQVTAQARVLMEGALARVAEAEGLLG
jgi:MerR family transcriptional regulator, light-induced transcriptional regulator